jgi:membrane protein implicated in regulation of membrane protease activity
MTLAITVVSVIFSAVAIVLAVLAARLNAKTERTYRRMAERERIFYGR